MNNRKVKVFVAVFLLCLFFGWSQIYAQVKPIGPQMTIRISHQWPGGTIDKGDFRDRLSRLFAQKVGEKTGGALKFEIYPASALFKAGPQYDAMLKGALDMSVYPLDYAAGKIPQFSITLMPAVVKDHSQAMRWKDAPIGKEIEKLSEENGMKIITWAWCGGGMAGKAKPLIKPEDMQNVKIRAAGKMFEKMLHASGAGISSMPSSEIYFALQTGVLDACMTSFFFLCILPPLRAGEVLHFPADHHDMVYVRTAGYEHGHLEETLSGAAEDRSGSRQRTREVCAGRGDQGRYRSDKPLQVQRRNRP